MIALHSLLTLKSTCQIVLQPIYYNEKFVTLFEISTLSDHEHSHLQQMTYYNHHFDPTYPRQKLLYE